MTIAKEEESVLLACAANLSLLRFSLFEKEYRLHTQNRYDYDIVVTVRK